MDGRQTSFASKLSLTCKRTVFVHFFFKCKDQLAAQISSWIHEFRDNDQARLYIDAGFATFAREWWGIDRSRLSKFMTVNK